MRALAVLAALAALAGCQALAAPAWIGLGGAAAGSTITAIHDCRQDGGCKAIPLPP